MNFDDLQAAWKSPHNQPAAEAMETQRRRFVSEFNRRRRGTWLFLGVIFVVLTVLTARLIGQIVWPGPSMDEIDATQEWGSLVFLSLPWIAALAFARLQFSHRRSGSDYQQSIGDSVQALLVENRNARRRYLIAAGVNLVMMTVLPLVVHQLREVGKAGDEILFPAFVLFPAIMLLVFAAMAWRYRRKLLPEKRRLEALLRSYQIPAT